MKVGDSVTINIDIAVTIKFSIEGKVIGRTYERDPHIDVMTPWGNLNGIPLSVLQRSLARERAPANVSVLRQGSWPSRKAGRALDRLAPKLQQFRDPPEGA